MITITNSNAMKCLLEALGFKNINNRDVDDDKMTLNINISDIVYAITTADEDIQSIYGLTPEWQELIGLYAIIVNDDRAM